MEIRRHTKLTLERNFIGIMFDLKAIRILTDKISDDNKYGCFTVGPLLRGFGTTIGNSLRRVMLSSLPGAAVSSILIDGVQHEFSTIPGVREDVTEIVLNLKSLAIRDKSGNNRPKSAFIDCVGEQVVRASDIIADTGIEFADPDHVIATLDNQKSSLRLYMVITSGYGYVAAEDQSKDEVKIIGRIYLDADYTPVERVNIHVTDQVDKCGRKEESLTLEVWTNGAMDPEEAVRCAAKIIVQHFSLLASFGLDSDEEYKDGNVPEETLNLPIENAGLSQSSYNCLKRAGINTIRELYNMTISDLSNVKGLGKAKQTEICEVLSKYNISMRA